MTGALKAIGLAAVIVTLMIWSAPPPARAVSPGGALCSLTGLVSGALGKVCTVATHAGKVIGAGKKLLGGHLGGAIGTLTGSGVKRATTAAVGLTAIVAAVAGGARYALMETAKVIGATTRPNLESTWFSSSYWRMAAVSALLTLPFLFAAAIQAMIRSDLGLLARAAFGYLPLGLLAVGVATPLTMLLLAGSDEMSAIVSSASGHAGVGFLDRAGALAGAISAASGSLFVVFFIGLLTAAATIALWVELLVRQAAVYVIVLMLPLFFAAMVWPARRIWAIRAVELLIALILSKFAIVAVLALGGAALGHTVLPGPEADLTGATLVLLAAFSPWALLRLLPLHELAGAAAAGMSGPGARGLARALTHADGTSDHAEVVAAELPARLTVMMRAQSRGPATDGGGSSPRGDALRAGALIAGTSSGAETAAGTAQASAAAGAGETSGLGAAVPTTGATGAEVAERQAEASATAPGAETLEPGACPQTGTPPSDSMPRDHTSRASERLPGMGDLFQAPNGGWRPLSLNADEFGTDRPLLEPDTGPSGLDPGPLASRPESPASRPEIPAASAETQAARAGSDPPSAPSADDQDRIP